LNPGVKPALDNVILKALARDPEKRYRSAEEMGDELEALVLRKQYSARALARKAKELAQEEGTTAAIGMIARATPFMTGTQAEAIVQPIGGIGSGNVSAFIDASSGRGIAKEQMAAEPMGTPARLAARSRTARSANKTKKSGRWKGTAVAAVCLIVGIVVGAVALRPSAVTAPSTSSENAPPANARITLDSAPQGATVVTVRDGRRLGETPLLLDLPRGQEVMEVTLTKSGFATLPFKVIPNQDKDVVAQLEPLGASAPAPAAPVTVPRRAETPFKSAKKVPTAVVPPRPSTPPTPPRVPATAPRAVASTVAPAAIPRAPTAAPAAVPARAAAPTGARPLKPGASR
jgi:PEGA domain